MPRLRVALVVALLATLAILWQLKRKRGDGGAAEAPASTTATHASITPVAKPDLAKLPAPDEVPIAQSVDRLRQIRDDYRRVSIYPPWSRPHDAGTAYKLDYNRAIVSDLPMSDKEGSETSYRFAADRAHVAFGEALTSWIEVWRTGDETKRLPLTIHNAHVMAVTGDAQGRTIALVYRDDGTNGDAVAGDLVYTNRFVPAEHDELRVAQQVHILADVEAEGVRKPLMRDFTYTPRPVLEVVGVTDAIEDGSLIVTLDVEVFEPGLHTIEANVLAEDGRPLGYTDVSFTLEAGRRTVKLPFFGRLFHDAGVDGPYLVRQLRGVVRKDVGEANLFWEDARTHTTRAWRRDELSPKEWESAEKDEKLRGLDDLLRQAEAGGPPPGTPPPRHIVVDDDGNEREVSPPTAPR